MVDWGAGRYEHTAAELEPVSVAVVDAAQPSAGDRVLDIACGTGNAALIAAECGARVVGVDSAPRLLGVARERARSRDLEVDFREGDLLQLPVADDSADVVLSVFGIIFARDPVAALREVARAAAPGARVFLTAWVPAGPINDMLTAMGRVVSRLTEAPSLPRFAWSDAGTVEAVVREAGLTLSATTPGRLAIRADSPEDYVQRGREHPMSLSVQAALDRADADAEVRGAMTDVLREANEDPAAFLVHSPYVVHQLRA
jgi:SAM-dependent methyltransferase